MKFLFSCCLVILMGSSLTAQEIAEWKGPQLEAYINDSGDAPIKVINMWATFCKPCIKEIPSFIRVVEGFSGMVSLMLVSVDMESAYPEAIQKMASEKHFKAPIVWLNETNADYFCPIVSPEWSGAIPATLVVNNATGFRFFAEEELSAEKLTEVIRNALNSSK